MKRQQINEEQKRILEQVFEQQAKKPWKQAVIENLVAMGLTPLDRLELRVTRKEHADIFQLAQKAADAFFSAFNIYPTSLAVHSTVARLFEASEYVIKAKHRGGEGFVAIYGKDLVLSPLHIEMDDSLDTRTIAVRFEIHVDDYQDALLTTLKDVLGL